jgi:hypothetical protein
MKHRYKEYEIETSARKQSDGWWTGKANISPAVAGVRGIQIIGDFISQTRAEDAAFNLAKQQIHMHVKN